MDPTSRLRIATRIHFALMRHMGSGIDVGYMLRRADYAREVLYVCEGSGDAELLALMRRFELASREADAATRPAPLETAPAPLEWHSSTNFGASIFPEAGAQPAPPTPSRWHTASRWLGLDGADSK